MFCSIVIRMVLIFQSVFDHFCLLTCFKIKFSSYQINLVISAIGSNSLSKSYLFEWIFITLKITLLNANLCCQKWFKSLEMFQKVCVFFRQISNLNWLSTVYFSKSKNDNFLSFLFLCFWYLCTELTICQYSKHVIFQNNVWSLVNHPANLSHVWYKPRDRFYGNVFKFSDVNILLLDISRNFRIDYEPW